MSFTIDETKVARKMCLYPKDQLKLNLVLLYVVLILLALGKVLNI